MSRSRARVNRGLLALLVVVLALGLAFYLHNLSKTRAAERSLATKAPPTPIAALAAAPKASAPAVAPTPVRVEPAALVTVTPTAATTRPVSDSSTTTGMPSAPKLKADTIVKSDANHTVAPVRTATTAPTAESTAKPALSSALPAGASADQLFKDGKAKFDANELLPARESLNAALLSDRLSPTDAAAAKSTLAQINATVVFSSQRFADDPFGGTHPVVSGERLSRIANDNDVTVGLLKRVNNLPDERKLRAGASIKIIKGPFHAVVDKSDFTIDLYLGGAAGQPNAMYVTTYKVGLGKDNSTPTGVWMVEPGKKIVNPKYYSPRGEGTIEAGDPRNPLGQRWIGLAGIDGHAVGQASYGIHGTIEPDSIGKMASMGCIRMHNEDVELVFDLLIEGKSTVTVKD